MKAPSKIYAAIVDNRLDASFLGKSIGKNKYPEYIRKDLLLEWVDAMGKCSPSVALLANELIRKINAL